MSLAASWRVLSWNLYQRPWFVADRLDAPWLPPRRERLRAILGRIAGADIACFQEVFHGAARFALVRRFGHGTPKLDRLFPVRLHSGLLIASRLPVAAHGGRIFRSGRGADRCVDKGVLRAEIAGVSFFDVHLQSGPHPAIRASQMREVVEFVSRTPGPAVLAGDFNLRPGEDAAMEPVTALGFRDAWLETHPGDAGLRLDRILVRGLRAAEVEMTWTPCSDHASLLARLEPGPI